jgi:hypothetical protein
VGETSPCTSIGVGGSCCNYDVAFAGAIGVDVTVRPEFIVIVDGKDNKLDGCSFVESIIIVGVEATD